MMSNHDDDFDDDDNAAVLCCHCHRNPATVKVAFMSDAGGVLNEHFLCEQCASEISPKLTQGLSPEELSELLREFFGSDSLDDMITQAMDSSDVVGNLEESDVADITCPYCKTTLRSFQKTGRLGCSRCYRVFRDVCLENIPLWPGDEVARHVGMCPQDGSTVSDRVLHTTRLHALRKQLLVALRSEDYLSAAKLRDQIKRLK